MILSAQSIRGRVSIVPFHERTLHEGMSFGLGPASYDLRIDQDVKLAPGEFRLASAMERVKLPNDVSAQVADKSSWARHGLSLFNTFVDPGWEGYLTLELINLGPDFIYIDKGDPICQLIFSKLDEPTSLPYRGKYFNQPAHPVPPIEER